MEFSKNCGICHHASMAMKCASCCNLEVSALWTHRDDIEKRKRMLQEKLGGLIENRRKHIEDFGDKSTADETISFFKNRYAESTIKLESSLSRIETLRSSNDQRRANLAGRMRLLRQANDNIYEIQREKNKLKIFLKALIKDQSHQLSEKMDVLTELYPIDSQMIKSIDNDLCETDRHHSDDSAVAGYSLGNAAYLIYWLSKYLGTSLIHPVCLLGSKSSISVSQDTVISHPLPLYSEVDEVTALGRFISNFKTSKDSHTSMRHGVELLKTNIEYLSVCVSSLLRHIRPPMVSRRETDVNLFEKLITICHNFSIKSFFSNPDSWVSRDQIRPNDKTDWQLI